MPLRSKHSEEVVPTPGVLKRLRPEDIKPSQHNPRHLFDRPEIEELKKSIHDKGVLVPITVYQPKGQTKFSILDGERRYRCVLELNAEDRDLDIPANVVEPPSKLAGLLYMFNIHNFREAWELMPTALGLKIVIEELGENETQSLAKLTGLSETQVERCKKLLLFPERYQQMSLDPDPKTRIPPNFWIEALPVLELAEKELPQLFAEFGRDNITDKLVEKYRNKRIKSVIHFRRIMESYDLSDDDRNLRARVLRRLEKFLLDPSLETRAAFDEFVVDQRRTKNALDVCDNFLASLQRLRLTYTTDDADRDQLRKALRHVEAYCKSLYRALEGRDEPIPKELAEN
ncbi:MAG: ParB N-terminal domain-containing protein [Terriglobales bacterium]